VNTAKLELHYYFPDDSHSIDANIRNKCEAELLALFAEASDILGIKVSFESEAFKEGGLRELWKALGKNGNQITILLTIIAILLSRVPLSSPEKEALDIELTKLKIEEQTLQIKKLRQELNEPNPTKEITEDAVSSLIQNTKIVVRRSNFFKHLTSYQKVQSISVTPFNEKMEPLQDTDPVSRKFFSNFILHTHTIKPIIIDDAVIEIISPVLKEGSYKWRGYFEEDLLSFSMLDTDFIKQVLHEEITFQHGTFIECVLNINRKLDEVGEVVITGYAVSIVIRKFDDRQSIETNKGKRYKHAKKVQDNQKSLFE